MNSRMEQIIDEIEEYIDGCKVQAWSNGTRIIVNKETIDELLTELRMKTPEEITPGRRRTRSLPRLRCRRQSL